MARNIFNILLASLCIAAAQAFVAPQPRCHQLSSSAATPPPPSTTTSSTSSPFQKSSPEFTIHTALSMSSSENQESSLPFWLDPNTKGGVIVWSIILFVVPFIVYSLATGLLGVDGVEAGKWIGVGFTAIGTFAWVGTYVFRVATKDMTYVSYVA